ncbi:MAG: Clp protease N-terminal domain-containing protein [Chloroflexota bacterium]
MSERRKDESEAGQPGASAAGAAGAGGRGQVEQVGAPVEPLMSLRDRLGAALERRLGGVPPSVRAALGGAGRREPFEKFTEKAKLTLHLAQQEAQRFNHNYIGTEHLLLGLVASDGIAGKVLAELEIGTEQVCSAVEFVVGRGDKPVSGEVSLTPRAKRALELAVDEASHLRHSHVGTEHLLLGLIREGEGVGAGVLDKLGASLERVRARVIAVTSSGVYAPETAGTKDSVVTCRVDAADLWAIDMLVEAGIRSTRSDAAQWLIHAGVEANRSLFDQVQTTVAEIRRLREQARQMASQGGGRAEAASGPSAASA